jgi:hypothetical protein
MEKIPIKFDYKGKHYDGTFDLVHGAGGNTWHLMINKYYCGRLRLTADGEWFFDSAQGDEFKELTDYFAQYMVAWHQ